MQTACSIFEYHVQEADHAASAMCTHTATYLHKSTPLTRRRKKQVTGPCGLDVVGFQHLPTDINGMPIGMDDDEDEDEDEDAVGHKRKSACSEHCDGKHHHHDHPPAKKPAQIKQPEKAAGKDEQKKPDGGKEGSKKTNEVKQDAKKPDAAVDAKKPNAQAQTQKPDAKKTEDKKPAEGKKPAQQAQAAAAQPQADFIASPKFTGSKVG